MTPVSLNPQPQNAQFFISPINQDSTPTFFNLLDPTQTTFQNFGDFRQNHDHQGDHNKVVLHDGSSSNEQVYNSSEEPARSARDTKNLTSLEEDSKSGHGSTKWMSSKMRLMKKMMRPSSSGSTDKAIMMNAQRYENRYSQTSPTRNNNNTVRVCSDCNTNSTPLWRSGPMGPKTLCNACGIRQRKARRAMAEATNGSTKTKVHNKDKKKPLVNDFTQFKNKNKSTSGSSSTTTTTAGSSQDVKKLECYALNLRGNSDFEGAFPSDEVAEAALLLMDISCGYIYS